MECSDAGLWQKQAVMLLRREEIFHAGVHWVASIVEAN